MTTALSPGKRISRGVRKARGYVGPLALLVPMSKEVMTTAIETLGSMFDEYEVALGQRVATKEEVEEYVRIAVVETIDMCRHAAVCAPLHGVEADVAVDRVKVDALVQQVMRTFYVKAERECADCDGNGCNNCILTTPET